MLAFFLRFINWEDNKKKTKRSFFPFLCCFGFGYAQIRFPKMLTEKDWKEQKRIREKAALEVKGCIVQSKKRRWKQGGGEKIQSIAEF